MTNYCVQCGYLFNNNTRKVHTLSLGISHCENCCHNWNECSYRKKSIRVPSKEPRKSASSTIHLEDEGNNRKWLVPCEVCRKKDALEDEVVCEDCKETNYMPLTTSIMENADRLVKEFIEQRESTMDLQDITGGALSEVLELFLVSFIANLELSGELVNFEKKKGYQQKD